MQKKFFEWFQKKFDQKKNFGTIDTISKNQL